MGFGTFFHSTLQIVFCRGKTSWREQESPGASPWGAGLAASLPRRWSEGCSGTVSRAAAPGSAPGSCTWGCFISDRRFIAAIRQ